MIPFAVMALAGLLLAVFARRVGRAMRWLDGGKLMRAEFLSGDRRAYAIYVRLMGLLLFGVAGLVTAMTLIARLR